MTTILTVKPVQATQLIIKYIKAGCVPMISGSPGIGKSSIVRQIAKQYNLKVIDLRLSQCDPTDLLGFPQIKGNRASYVPMETFPLEGDPLPINPETGKPYDGWLLFLDEFSSASHAVQAAAYKLVLDRMVGQSKIHSKVAIVGAGNLATDNAIVEAMSTAMQSRLAHLDLVVDAKEFCDHASSEGWDHRITDYIKFKPDAVYTFSPDHTDRTYACPRTWEFTNNLLNTTEEGDKDRLHLLSGVLSEGVAREFTVFMKIYASLPKLEDILRKPTTIAVPEELSVIYALIGSLANHADEDNITNLLIYLKRIEPEFQITALRDIVRRKKDLMGHPAMTKWISESSALLF